MNHDELITMHRQFLKDSIRKEIDFSRTAQNLGVEPPPAERPLPDGAERTTLVPYQEFGDIARMPVSKAIRERRSRRKFRDAPVDLKSLSFLLWATQGVQRKFSHGTTFRTVPSAGARHALETYVCALRVGGLPAGIYRYLPLSHELARVGSPDSLPEKLTDGALGQTFAGTCSATFVWTAVPERMEWRYDLAAHKVILLDAGHICQNLYVACEAVGLGTCAIAAYDQEKMDSLLGVDGVSEFTIYMAPVGKA